MLADALPQVAQKVRNLIYLPLRCLKGIAYPDGFHVLKLVKAKQKQPFCNGLARS